MRRMKRNGGERNERNINETKRIKRNMKEKKISIINLYHSYIPLISYISPTHLISLELKQKNNLICLSLCRIAVLSILSIYLIYLTNRLPDWLSELNWLNWTELNWTELNWTEPELNWTEWLTEWLSDWLTECIQVTSKFDLPFPALRLGKSWNQEPQAAQVSKVRWGEVRWGSEWVKG